LGRLASSDQTAAIVDLVPWTSGSGRVGVSGGDAGTDLLGGGFEGGQDVLFL
jgi:hypothetical protein